MNHQLWKRIGIELFFIFIISLTPLLWFREGAIFVGHDNTYPLQAQPFLENRLHTWSENFFGHDQSLIMGTIPIHILDALPTYLGFDRITGQKIVYVIWFFLIGLAAYVLASVLFLHSRVFKLVAVFFYQFNFFILQGWWIGEKSKFSAYIAQPLILAVFIVVTEKKLPVIVGASLISIILFLFNAGGLYGIPLYGGLLVAIFCFLVWTAIRSIIERDISIFGRSLLLLVVSGVLTLLVNAYYFAPAIAKFRTRIAIEVAQIGGTSGVISWADEISAHASFLNLMRLQGIPEWYDNPSHPYAKNYLTNPIFIAISFLFPVLVFASLLIVTKKEQKYIVILFFLIYLVGLLFTAGTHPPLGFIYQTLVQKIPGFFIFRSPFFKFAAAVMLAQAFLSAYTIENVSPVWRKRLAVLVAIGLLFYHAPYFTGNFFNWRDGYSTRLQIPEYVYSFGIWLEGHPRARVLMLPPNSPNFSYSVYEWGYLSFQALPTLVSKGSAIINNDKLNGGEQELVEFLYSSIANGDKERTSRLSSLLGITHILLQHDTSKDIISSLPVDSETYEKNLKNMGLFKGMETLGEWDLYELQNAQSSKFISASTFETVDAPISDLEIFVDHLQSPTVFIQESNTSTANPIIVAECANCPKKGRPIVIFPDRTILPDDPFYPIVTFMDRFRKVPVEPKSAIYSLLGVTLKQISEVNQVIIQQKQIPSELVSRYSETLGEILVNFEKLPTLKEKISVASDIEQYLREERNYIRPNLGRFVTGGTQTILVGSIFSSIAQTQLALNSYTAPYGDTATRLYQLTVNAPNEYDIFINSADLSQYNDTEVEATLGTGNSELKKTILPGDTRNNRWISLGTTAFTAGYHVMNLRLPDVTGEEISLLPIDTEFNARGENVCFGDTIDNLTGKQLYQFKVDYVNDFSDNLLLFIWEKEKEKDQNKLIITARLQANTLEDRVSEAFELSDNANQAVIAICAPNLSQERATTNLSISLSRLVYPSIVLVPDATQKVEIVPLEFDTKSTTAHEAKTPMAPGSSLLVFYERYDPWWDLEGVPGKHVLVNGYANGWIVDSPEGKTVTVRYRGDRYFHFGVLISFVVLAGSAIVVWRYRHRLYVHK